MRVTKLEQAAQSIQSVTPRWMSRMCALCGDMIKGEPMWSYRRYGRYSLGGYSYKLWVCHECAPNKSDVLKRDSIFFGPLDTTPLEQEEQKLIKVNFKGKERAPGV